MQITVWAMTKSLSAVAVAGQVQPHREAGIVFLATGVDPVQGRR
jgi:hypothetical protein